MSKVAGGTAAGDVKAARGPLVFSRGKLVVVEHGAALPDRCIRCNGEAGGRRVRENFFWIDRDSRERGRFWLLVPRVGALLREWHWEKHGMRATVEVGLCARHRGLRAAAPLMVLGGVAGMVGVLGMTFDARSPSPWPVLAGFACLAGGVMGWAWARRTARAHHIDGSGAVTLAGAGERFVRSLPVDPRPGEMAAAAARLAGVGRRKG